MLALCSALWISRFQLAQAPTQNVEVTPVVETGLRDAVSETSIIKDFRDFEKWELHDFILESAPLFEQDPKLAWRIIWCESNGWSMATNASSTASGLFQFIESTWKLTPQGRAGKNVLDPKSNLLAGLWLMSQPSGLNNWSETAGCWLKF